MSAPGGADELKMGFVGVTTGSSSMMRVFPRWAELLDLPTRRLVGYDVPLDADDATYRQLLGSIRDDPGHLGALVTTHKMRLFESAADMFDELDTFARLCGEVSSVSKRDGRLVGHAKDPLTAGLSMEEFLDRGYFARTGGEVVCLGAGGAGTAITWYLAGRDDRPARIVCADTDARRLEHLRRVHADGGLDTALFRYELVASATDGDGLVAGAPRGSLVVNATGLGKDRPGSPLGPAATFPADGVVWELNYRGSLEFLAQARAQQAQRGLTVVDGWRYFIHGWSQVVAEVFHLALSEDLVAALAAAAEGAC